MIWLQMNILSCCQRVLQIAKEFCRPKEIENTTGNLKDRHYEALEGTTELLWFLAGKHFIIIFLMLLSPKKVVKFSLGKFLL